jgi:hypothetical protein
MTAVEWLVERLNKNGLGVTQDEINQAKEMERIQLEKFYNHGCFALIDTGHGDTFEEYYNETFNK